MQDDASLKENYEERLLSYMDIPYFRNNPTYIELWRRYYEHHRDPQILLLMYYKEISTHYHWIYVELAKHFVRLNRVEIAHFVLNEALQNKVYDRERLVDTISRLPPFEKKYSKGDMACVLNQKNIRAVGKVWNKYEEVFFYERYLDASSVNFEMMKLNEYLETGNLGADEDQGPFFADGLRTEHSDDPVFVQTIYFGKAKRLRADSRDSGQNACSPQNSEHSAGTSSLGRREEHGLVQHPSCGEESGCKGAADNPGVKEHEDAPKKENKANTHLSRESVDEEMGIDATFTGRGKDSLISDRAADSAFAFHGAAIMQDSRSGASKLGNVRRSGGSVSLSRSDLVDENIGIDSLVRGEYDHPHAVARKSVDTEKASPEEKEVELRSNSTLVSEDGSGFMAKKCRDAASDQNQRRTSMGVRTSLKPAGANPKATVEDECGIAQQDTLRGHAEVYEVLGDLEDNSELVINNFVHLVQESGDGFYLTMRIARDADITQTLAGRSFCLRKITERNAIILNGVRKSEYCVSRDSLFVMFEFDKLESLSKILTFCDPTTSLFYLKQVLAVVDEFLKKSVVLCNLNFFVDQGFNAVLFDNTFECSSKIDEGRVAEGLRTLFGGCDIDFGRSLAGIAEEANLKTDTREFRLALLRHKAAVLNAL